MDKCCSVTEEGKVTEYERNVLGVRARSSLDGTD